MTKGANLCTDCFAKRGSLHLFDDCEDHTFRCIPFDWAAARRRARGGVGMTKGAWAARRTMNGMWAKGKGMCGGGRRKDTKCKGLATTKGLGDVACDPQPCAGGCGMQVTWHPTHCCRACAVGSRHGRKCDLKVMPGLREDPVGGESAGGKSTSDRCAPSGKQCEGWFLRPKKLLWALSRLRSGGALSGRAVASFFVHLIPGWVAHASSSDSAMVDRRLEKVLPMLHSALEGLSEVVERNPGLESCKASVRAFVEDGTAPAGRVAIVAVLSALQDLAFEDRIAVVEEFYSSQETRFHQLLDWAETRMPAGPPMPVEHSGVMCDGCGASPMIGLRFKCNVCPDFNLCADCFAKRGSLHLFDDCEDHTFRCIPFDWRAAQRRGRGGLGLKKGAWAARRT